MNIKDFSQPTILKGTQYGTTVTIELDHSDTSIDEVMGGFLTIAKGLGYLDSTINEWIKDKAKEVYDDEHTIIKDALWDDFDAYSWMNNGEDMNNSEEIEKADKDYSRMDIIGQNGNEGLHYGIATDEDIEECNCNDEVSETNDDTIDWGLERPSDEYKGIYIQQPEEEFNDYGQRITFEWGDTPEDEDELFGGEEWEPNEAIERAKEVYDRSVIETERFRKVKEAAKKWSDEVKEKHVPIKNFDIVDMETGEVTNERELNVNLYKRKPNQPVTPKKMNKGVVKKGKIKDLKK